MKSVVELSTYFGFVISIGAYLIGMKMQEKFKLAIFNPLLLSIIIIIAVLTAGKVDYETYNESAKYLTYLLTPSIVALAVPLYDKLKILKENIWAVLIGILSGVLASFVSVLVISVLFSLTHEQYVTLLPKSITTAIGMGLSEEFGGIQTITTATIVLTGIFGGMVGKTVLRLLKIKNPVAKGLAMGTSAHAMGTSKALEMGVTEGAVSGLAIAVSGLMTVICINLFVLCY